MKGLLPLLVLLPHLSVFIGAGVSEFMRWREIDADERPGFLAYLGRVDTPPGLPRTDVETNTHRGAQAKADAPHAAQPLPRAGGALAANRRTDEPGARPGSAGNRA